MNEDKSVNPDQPVKLEGLGDASRERPSEADDIARIQETVHGNCMCEWCGAVQRVAARLAGHGQEIATAEQQNANVSRALSDCSDRRDALEGRIAELEESESFRLRVAELAADGEQRGGAALLLEYDRLRKRVEELEAALGVRR